jgi:acetyl-CoA synthetase
MLDESQTYEEAVSGFEWHVPDDFNIAEYVSARWARSEPDRVCLQHFDLGGNHASLTYAELDARASALARALKAEGVSRGDRVAILLPQSFETAIAHVAIYKMAAIAVPLALLFGQDALSYRLAACGARAIVTNAMGVEKLQPLRDALPDLKTVIVTGDAVDSPALGFNALVQAYRDGPPIDEPTTGDTPALMVFTSGTTGPPKGALHGHRVLIGHLPGVQMHHEFLPQPGDKLWTPADWAWAGGLLNVLLPGLYFGVPVVATPAQKFDPDLAFRIMAELDVRNAFIPPTALRMLRSVVRPAEKYSLNLRTIGSGGESLGRETFEWGRRELGVTINEFYGQTECNLVLASCAKIGVSRSGAIGKTVPGHSVAVIDADGVPCAPGTPGQIAIRRPDPVMFLGYWNDEAATERKFIGDWMTTGDQGVMSEDGYVEFFGRDDDVITSAGYRIGPGEVEDCLHAHEAIALAAAVGKPDPIRTEAVKAYVVLKPGFQASERLASEITAWVKTRLSAHEYPREVAFVDSLPLTTTGKVIRRELRQRAIEEAAAGV